MNRGLMTLLAVGMLVGCVGTQRPSGSDDDATPDVGGGGGGGGGGQALPSELVGSWYAGRGGTSAPYDPATGSWGTPNGDGLVYLFEADGSYTKAFQSYASNGGCTTGFSAFEAGQVWMDDAMLTTHPTSGHLVFEDTCSPSLDSDEPLDSLQDETFTWELRSAELWLQRVDGPEATFQRL